MKKTLFINSFLIIFCLVFISSNALANEELASFKKMAKEIANLDNLIARIEANRPAVGNAKVKSSAGIGMVEPSQADQYRIKKSYDDYLALANKYKKQREELLEEYDLLGVVIEGKEVYKYLLTDISDEDLELLLSKAIVELENQKNGSKTFGQTERDPLDSYMWPKF